MFLKLFIKWSNVINSHKLEIYFNQIKNTMQSYEKPKKDEKNKGPLKTDINRI